MAVFTPIECQQLEANIRRYIDTSVVFLESLPENQDVAGLPRHIQNASNLLIDLRELEPRLPQPFYGRLRLRLHRILNELHDIEDFLLGAPQREAEEVSEGPIWVSLSGGRQLVLREDTLRALCDLGFTDKDIGAWMGCSRRTIIRRRIEWGIQKRDYTDVSDEELIRYIERVLTWGSGQEGLQGVTSGLEVLGIKAPRARLRDLLRQFDRGDIGVAPLPVVRRVYTVPCINAMWHIDGHHKLIRWKIVIHGGIDGFSRMVVYLQASDNNRAETHLAAFREGVGSFGLPNRVRADRGGENLGIKQLMEQERGLHRGSFIQGRSVHNQRIERLWVDLQRWCTNRYRTIFEYLEQQRLLDPDDPFHLWALHFCYLPMINGSLIFFANRWNRHRIRTAHHDSPMKIWVRCAKALGFDPLAQPARLLGEDEDDEDFQWHLQRNMADYGIDHFEAQAGAAARLDDPFVHVDPILGGVQADVAEYMASAAFLQAIGEVAGQGWPPPADFGVARFSRVIVHLGRAIDTRFPQYAPLFRL